MKIPRLILGAVVGGLLTQSAAFASGPRWTDTVLLDERGFDDRGPRARGSSAPQMSEQEAARRAQAEHGGRVLAVTPEGGGFRVKLLKDGVVRTVFVAP